MTNKPDQPEKYFYCGLWHEAHKNELLYGQSFQRYQNIDDALVVINVDPWEFYKPKPKWWQFWRRR